MGLGGILSVIGAGLSLKSAEKTSSAVAATTPMPNYLSKMLLTDPRENLLSQCPDNLVAVSFPTTKVQLGLLDWNAPIQDEFKGKFNTIIGCDCTHHLESVEPLAKTIVDALQNPAFETRSSKQQMTGSFLLIGPHNRRTTADLKNTMQSKYHMEAVTSEIILERFQLKPLVMESFKHEVDRERDGYVEFTNMHSLRYSVLVGHHSGTSACINGDKFTKTDTADQPNSQKPIDRLPCIKKIHADSKVDTSFVTPDNLILEKFTMEDLIQNGDDSELVTHILTLSSEEAEAIVADIISISHHRRNEAVQAMEKDMYDEIEILKEIRSFQTQLGYLSQYIHVKENQKILSSFVKQTQEEKTNLPGDSSG